VSLIQPPTQMLNPPKALVIVTNRYGSPYGTDVSEFEDIDQARKFFESILELNPIFCIVKNWTLYQ
jgi:hypothetical protein